MKRPEFTTCAVCGKVFPVSKHGSFPRCCSDYCRNKDYVRRREENAADAAGANMVCARCGRPFRWARSPTGNQEPPMYCTARCATLAAHEADPDKVKAYNAGYYSQHKERWAAKKSSRPKKTDQEKREALKRYQHEYYMKITKKKRRAKAMMKREFVLNLMENDREGINHMSAEQAAEILDWVRGDDENGELPDMTAEEFAAMWNEIKGVSSKRMEYCGKEVELIAVSFRYQDEPTLQQGVLARYASDEFRDSDAIYGNGWTLESVNDDYDLACLLEDTCGTTYWHYNGDGTYTVDA